MAYIDYEFFASLYGDIPETDFNRLSWEACRKLDVATTGIDNVKKLRVAFPTDEDDAETVKRCACALVDILNQINQAQKAAMIASGYTETENGLQGRVISSKSAGNESISYAVGNNATATTSIGKAIEDMDAQEQILNDTIREYLSGVTDANGINLLYMGSYPFYVK